MSSTRLPPNDIMDDRDVELDSLLPRSSSRKTSDHGEQPAASVVNPREADQDIGIHDLPPLPPSGPSSHYSRGQSPSNPPSIHASSAYPIEHPIARQPPATAPLIDLIGDKLQSVIGLLQETVNTLRKPAAAVQIADPDAASLQEVVVAGRGRAQEPFVLERVKVMSEEEIATYEEEWSNGWKSKLLLLDRACLEIRNTDQGSTY